MRERTTAHKAQELFTRALPGLGWCRSGHAGLWWHPGLRCITTPEDAISKSARMKRRGPRMMRPAVRR